MFHYVKPNKQHGFSLVEAALALTVMAILLAATIKLINSYGSQMQQSQQKYQVQMLAAAIKLNAKLIMDAAPAQCTGGFAGPAYTLSSACGGAAYDSTPNWGWMDGCCQHTSPFPTLKCNAGPPLTLNLQYSIDRANFVSQASTIIQNIGPYCPYNNNASNATTLVFNCSNLLGENSMKNCAAAAGDANMWNDGNGQSIGIDYQVGSGTANIVHQPGNNLDFTAFPSALNISYDDYAYTSSKSSGGLPVNKPFTLDFTDLYMDRVKKSRDYVTTIDSALRTYAIQMMTTEYTHVPPAGLDSKDTFFVPWVWQVLADPSNYLQLCCDTACSHISVSGACGATTFSSVWTNVNNSIPPSVPNVWRSLITNLGLNSNYTMDAFGNPLRISLIANGCAGGGVDVTDCSQHVSCSPATNGGLCRDILPPTPTSSYVNSMPANFTPRPPYTSLIVSEPCFGAGSWPDFCRWTIIYSN